MSTKENGRNVTLGGGKLGSDMTRTEEMFGSEVGDKEAVYELRPEGKVQDIASTV